MVHEEISDKHQAGKTEDSCVVVIDDSHEDGKATGGYGFGAKKAPGVDIRKLNTNKPNGNLVEMFGGTPKPTCKCCNGVCAQL
jgi:hypothetical protein